MNKSVFWIVLLLALGGWLAWYLMHETPPEQHSSFVIPEQTPAPSAEQSARHPISEPMVEAEVAPQPLPALRDSDSPFIEALAGLVGAEALGSRLVMEQVISRTVATIDSLDAREIAPVVLPLTPPEGAIRVSTGETLALHAANARRYDPYVGMVNRLDSASAVAVYQRYYPLFQESWQALGNTDSYFNDRLVDIIDHLLATPSVDRPLTLERSEALYLWADPRLESLSAGQKMLLRIGPEHAQTLRQKLQEIRALLVDDQAGFE